MQDTTQKTKRVVLQNMKTYTTKTASNVFSTELRDLSDTEIRSLGTAVMDFCLKNNVITNVYLTGLPEIKQETKKDKVKVSDDLPEDEEEEETEEDEE